MYQPNNQMKKTLLILSSFLILASCQKEPQVTKNKVVFTDDIDHFWEAFDSIQTTDEYNKQLDYINRLYIDKATVGLQSFMKSRRYKDSLYVYLINELPKFWASLRPNTLKIKEQVPELEKSIEKFRMLYPELTDAKMYFTIGGLNSGGTADKDMILIGSEIGAADANVDTSEFVDDAWLLWLKDLFKKQSLDHLVYLNTHEYVHTQQNSDSRRVLNKSLKEGAADFIAELVVERELNSTYITYGRTHFEEVLADFKEEMFTENIQNWMFNGGRHPKCGDLGYFMGYAICKAYYEKAEDKKAAIKTIMELDFSDDEFMVEFLNQSGIYKETFENPKLILSDVPYNITFKVKVPNVNDEVFIVGDQDNLGSWNPGQVKMNKTSDLERSITLSLKSPIEFKFTRGSWETEGFIKGKTRGPNQRFATDKDSELSFEIESWKDDN